jgi:excisionase family DNA binding protein
MDNQKMILNPDDVAAEAGICRRTVYNLLRSGELPHVKAGDKYLISRRNFEKWANGECQAQTVKS